MLYQGHAAPRPSHRIKPGSALFVGNETFTHGGLGYRHNLGAIRTPHLAQFALFSADNGKFLSQIGSKAGGIPKRTIKNRFHLCTF